METALDCWQCPRRHAGRLDEAVKALVIVAECLVVRAVARLARRIGGNDEAGDATTAHSARGLDVFCTELRLTVDHHQAEAIDVDANRYDVGTRHYVDCRLFRAVAPCQ